MGVFFEVKSRHECKKVAPWAVSIAKVPGGYRAFASRADLNMWRRNA